jgi:hypothetical protein
VDTPSPPRRDATVEQGAGPRSAHRQLGGFAALLLVGLFVTMLPAPTDRQEATWPSLLAERVRLRAKIERALALTRALVTREVA